jgi:predicted homoserine dehydrogenase-like protein
LPIGLASFGRLTRAIGKDEPIPFEAVTFEEENLVLDLYRRQEAYVFPVNRSDVST